MTATASLQARKAGESRIRSRVVHQLRCGENPRPSVDPGLAGGLKAWLEDGAAIPTRDRTSHQPPIFLDPFEASAPSTVARPVSDDPIDYLRERLVEAIFRQVVVTGRINDPLADSLEALSLDHTTDGIGLAVASLSPLNRRRLSRDLARHVAHIRRDWGRIPMAWLPRTNQRLSVAIAGGRAVLVGTVNLMVGSPATDRSSVGMVILDARGDAPGDSIVPPVAVRHFISLLETIRTGAPPLRVATYFTSTGRIEAETPSDLVLARCVARSIEALDRLGQR